MTPKQEKFCALYLELGNASEAYRQAYDAAKMKPESVNRKAFELFNHVKITARLEQLREQHAERHEMTIDKIRDMLLEDREFARKMTTPAAAVSATMGLAKLYGHLTDKVDLRSSDRSMSPQAPVYNITEK